MKGHAHLLLSFACLLTVLAHFSAQAGGVSSSSSEEVYSGRRRTRDRDYDHERNFALMRRYKKLWIECSRGRGDETEVPYPPPFPDPVTPDNNRLNDQIFVIKKGVDSGRRQSTIIDVAIVSDPVYGPDGQMENPGDIVSAFKIDIAPLLDNPNALPFVKHIRLDPVTLQDAININGDAQILRDGEVLPVPHEIDLKTSLLETGGVNGNRPCKRGRVRDDYGKCISKSKYKKRLRSLRRKERRRLRRYGRN